MRSTPADLPKLRHRIAKRLGAVSAVTAMTAGLLGVTATGADAAAPRVDHILYWTQVIEQNIRTIGGVPTEHTRGFAMAYTAAYDAYNSVNHIGDPYLAVYPKKAGCKYDARQNVDYAIYGALKVAFPTVNNDTELAVALLDGPSGSGYCHDIGEAAAKGIIAARTNDGSASPEGPYTPKGQPGWWRPSLDNPVGFAASNRWGLVKPWAMTSVTQFRAPAPYGFAGTDQSTVNALLQSPAYRADLAEVKSLGAKNSPVRTAAQTNIGWFWANEQDGTYKPGGHLLQATSEVSLQRRLNQQQNVRLFALMSISFADGGITAWNTKWSPSPGVTPYVDLWRPYRAITEDPYGAADPNWLPQDNDTNTGATTTPPFSAYISGHSTFGGAWAGVMQAFFGTNNISYVLTSEDPHLSPSARVRSFSNFETVAQEERDSRIYLGVHYRGDGVQGNAAGHNVANWVTSRFLKPDTSAPIYQ